jgi:hypothetical protein
MALDLNQSHPSLPALYVVAAIAAAFQGANNPTQVVMSLSIVDPTLVVKANRSDLRFPGGVEFVTAA